MAKTIRPATAAELHEYGLRLLDAADHIDRARRSLADLAPGFPSSTHDAPPRAGGDTPDYKPERRELDDLTSGHGLPAAGPAIAGHLLLTDDVDVHELGHHPTSKSNVVDRAAGKKDEIRRLTERERALSTNLGPLITELYSIARKYGVAPAVPKIDPTDTNHEWCPNHLRITVCEPREPYKKPDGTTGLRANCAFCNNCKDAYSYTPTIELMELHRDRGGKRLSAAIYKAYHPVVRKTGPKNTKRKKARK